MWLTGLESTMCVSVKQPVGGGNGEEGELIMLGKKGIWPTVSFECPTLSPDPILPSISRFWVLAKREGMELDGPNGNDQSSRYCSIFRDLTAGAQIATL